MIGKVPVRSLVHLWQTFPRQSGKRSSNRLILDRFEINGVIGARNLPRGLGGAIIANAAAEPPNRQRESNPSDWPKYEPVAALEHFAQLSRDCESAAFGCKPPVRDIAQHCIGCGASARPQEVKVRGIVLKRRH